MEGTQNVLWIVKQAMAELGLPVPREVAASQDDLVRQFVALLNRCGYELVQGYPWEQLDKQFLTIFQTSISSARDDGIRGGYSCFFQSL